MSCIRWIGGHNWSKWETFELKGTRYVTVDGKVLSCPFTSIRQKRTCSDCGKEEWRTVEDMK